MNTCLGEKLPAPARIVKIKVEVRYESEEKGLFGILQSTSGDGGDQRAENVGGVGRGIREVSPLFVLIIREDRSDENAAGLVEKNLMSLFPTSALDTIDQS